MAAHGPAVIEAGSAEVPGGARGAVYVTVVDLAQLGGDGAAGVEHPEWAAVVGRVHGVRVVQLHAAGCRKYETRAAVHACRNAHETGLACRNARATGHACRNARATIHSRIFKA